MYEVIIVTTYRKRHAGKLILYLGALPRGWGKVIKYKAKYSFRNVVMQYIN
jgi:hypothetical protein